MASQAADRLLKTASFLCPAPPPVDFGQALLLGVDRVHREVTCMKLLIRFLIIVGFLSFLAIARIDADTPDQNIQRRCESVLCDLARLELKNDILVRTLAETIDLPTFNEILHYTLANQLSTSDQERAKLSFINAVRYMIQDLAPANFWEEHLAGYYAASLTGPEVQTILDNYDHLSDIPAGIKLKVLRQGFRDAALPDLLPEIKSWTQPFNIPTPGMAPTLLPGDNLFVNKLSYTNHVPKRGDVIVFRYPEDETKLFVKRVIGIPGDFVEIRKKVIYVNGQPLEEDSYVQHIDQNIIEASVNPRDNLSLITVPAGSYFTLGDNRDSSLDSRFWGFVKGEKVLGQVTIIYWSVDTVSKMPRWERMGLQVH
jgi:signal peptidase I